MHTFATYLIFTGGTVRGDQTHAVGCVCTVAEVYELLTGTPSRRQGA